MEEIIKDTATIHDLVAPYRELEPQEFSDSKIEYEIPLTRELFEKQLEILSTKKMQSEFENFIVGCAKRLITPNIKQQTGPDGGGDGKVDAETYEVSLDISDKWYISNEGASGNEKWAFAISCKQKWVQKVESDVSNIVSTNRGYTRILFFSNQYIKGKTRIEEEGKLCKRYGINVSIFDGLWCVDAVFSHGCMDIALNCLNFSDEYKRKQKIIGPLDQKRRQRLEKIEKGILLNVTGLDTGYIEELKETYILSRELELPRKETEGRFIRALRECEHHGTPQQQFNIVYDHAWTSYFWFEDIATVYDDYIKLKEFVREEVSVVRLEKLTTILTNLIYASRAGFFDTLKMQDEYKFIKRLQDDLQKLDKPSSLLYIKLYISEQDLITHALSGDSINEDIEIIKPLLLEVPYHLDISFENQFKVIKLLNKLIDDNPQYEDLIDELTLILKETQSEQTAARIEMDRAIELMNKKKYKLAIRHFSFCIKPFEKEECMTELTKVSGLMGFALYELGLPYSAETYLVQSASLLIKHIDTTGNIPNLLMSVLQKLCEIELMLGRLVMFLNWYELMAIISHNGQLTEDNQINKINAFYDGSWACRLAAADLKNPVMGYLPNILERAGMVNSSEYLKYLLGYADELEEKIKKLFSEEGLQEKMLEQPIFNQFLCELNVTTEGLAELQTTVNNCTLHIKYVNSCLHQIVAEIFLSTLEAMLATMEEFEVLTITPDVIIEIIGTENKTELKDQENTNRYILYLNQNPNSKKLWECVSMFIVYFFSRNAISKEKMETMLLSKQNGEKLMDRVSDLLQAKQSIINVLGETFKFRIEDWRKESDKIYSLKKELFAFKKHNYKNEKQQTILYIGTNNDMTIWEGAGWSGCGFVFDQQCSLSPILGLAFNNINRGKQIVLEWNRTQATPSVVIYIIRGINKQYPNWYRVCVAPMVKKDVIIENRYIASICRKHTMKPLNNWNLDSFEKLYNQYHSCLLMAFEIDRNNQIIMPKNLNEAYKFTNIEFRNAWEIEIDDMAKMAIEPDDEPYIPEDKKDNAPIIKVLKMLRDRVVNKTQ